MFATDLQHGQCYRKFFRRKGDDVAETHTRRGQEVDNLLVNVNPPFLHPLKETVTAKK